MKNVFGQKWFLVDSEFQNRFQNTFYCLYVYIYITSTYTRFKSKIYNHQVRQVFRTWDLNQQEFVQRN